MTTLSQFPKIVWHSNLYFCSIIRLNVEEVITKICSTSN